MVDLLLMAELDPNWPARAVCRDGDPEALFVMGAKQRLAKRICAPCPVRYECLADALDNRVEYGVWGGHTERERRAILRQYPVVESWWQVIGATIQKDVVEPPTSMNYRLRQNGGGG